MFTYKELLKKGENELLASDISEEMKKFRKNRQMLI